MASGNRTSFDDIKFYNVSIPLKEQCVFVCLLVCWSAFYWPHDICPLCGAASEWPREQPSCRGRPRARGQAHALARARTHAVQLLNEKNRTLMPFKDITVRARMLSYTYLPRFSKKGKRKPTCHFPSSVYSLPSLGVFTFRIVLNRTWSLVGADLGQLVYTYKRVVCVRLFVCWFVCFLSVTELAIYLEVNVINYSPNTSLLSTTRVFRAITLNYKQVTIKYNLRLRLCSHLTQQQEGV